MKFGSQGAKDAAAVREARIERGADRRVERLNQLDRILNRPIGSKVNVPREEQGAELAFLVENPQEAVMKIQTRAEAVGVDRAVLEFLQFADEFKEFIPPMPLPVQPAPIVGDAQTIAPMIGALEEKVPW